jgi:hypothetical protein
LPCLEQPRGFGARFLRLDRAALTELAEQREQLEMQAYHLRVVLLAALDAQGRARSSGRASDAWLRAG